MPNFITRLICHCAKVLTASGGGTLIDNGINQLSQVCDIVGELEALECVTHTPTYSKVRLDSNEVTICCVYGLGGSDS
jgi:hypothetical protein